MYQRNSAELLDLLRALTEFGQLKARDILFVFRGHSSRLLNLNSGDLVGFPCINRNHSETPI